MSYAMWPIESLSVNINDEYFNYLKEDLQNKDEILKQLKSKAKHGTISKYQFELFKDLCDNAEEILKQDLDDFYLEQTHYDNSYQKYDGGRYSENYAYSQKLNIDTGSYERDSEVFDGYVYEFNWGSPNVYEPQFKNKTYLIEEINGEDIKLRYERYHQKNCIEEDIED